MVDEPASLCIAALTLLVYFGGTPRGALDAWRPAYAPGRAGDAYGRAAPLPGRPRWSGPRVFAQA
jgi:hypothetical protein